MIKPSESKGGFIMTKTEMDIRSVLGPAGGSIRPLAAASDLFARRMFEERMDSEDIFLTKDIYPIVAVCCRRNPAPPAEPSSGWPPAVGILETGAG